jgi:hypothetical protein
MLRRHKRPKLRRSVYLDHSTRTRGVIVYVHPVYHAHVVYICDSPTVGCDSGQCSHEFPPGSICPCMYGLTSPSGRDPVTPMVLLSLICIICFLNLRVWPQDLCTVLKQPQPPSAAEMEQLLRETPNVAAFKDKVRQ